MKKYILYIIPLILLIIIVSVSFYLLNQKSKSKNCISNIDLNEIYASINLSTNNAFEMLKDDDATMYYPLDYSKTYDYLIARATDFNDEYYILMKNLDDKQLTYLRDVIDNKNKKSENYIPIKYNTYGEFTYVVFSQKYSSIIDGIIRSYVFCK